MFDAQLYRSKEEVEQWKEKGPLRRFRIRLEKSGLAEGADFGSMEEEVAREIDEAIAFAEAGSWEPVETMLEGVYTHSPS